MKRLMKEHGLSEPEFSEEGNFFIVKFHGPGDKILDLVPSIPKEKQIDLRELGLNPRQIEALKLMVNEGRIFTNTLYQKVFKISRRSSLRDLRRLVETGQATMMGVGKGAKYKTI
jgi:predicted HTH transcriptional regulator